MPFPARKLQQLLLLDQNDLAERYEPVKMHPNSALRRLLFGRTTALFSLLLWSFTEIEREKVKEHRDPRELIAKGKEGDAASSAASKERENFAKKEKSKHLGDRRDGSWRVGERQNVS